FALAYLFETRPSSFLADLEFEDGSPAFNDREVRHMEDVRRLTQAALKLWAAVCVVAAGAGIWVGSGTNLAALAAALRAGVRATFALTIGLGLLVALAFPLFFLGFHRVFFQGDTWLFAYSDTLIRLFPLRFWRDASIGFAVLTLGGLAILYLVSGAALRRPHPPSPSR
ncbi:MAG: TIGR01906 family membrane protein, partial [Anaerolineales bacterium]